MHRIRKEMLGAHAPQTAAERYLVKNIESQLRVQSPASRQKMLQIQESLEKHQKLDKSAPIQAAHTFGRAAKDAFQNIDASDIMDLAGPIELAEGPATRSRAGQPLRSEVAAK